MKVKVFIDGQSGTTGLKINERLAKRIDIELLKIEEEKKKDPKAKSEIINSSDIVILCLPDDAAKESVSLVKNPATKVIDTSTAHRVNPDWTYGLPEYEKDQREKIKNSKKVCVPGCHATGFILSLYPLVKNNIISPDYPVVAHSITGYSGGGKKLIEKFEKNQQQSAWRSSRHYALNLMHKHLPEMQKYTHLNHPPFFTPVVGNFYNGMAVGIALHKRLLNKGLNLNNIWEILASYYEGEYFVKVIKPEEISLEDGYFDPTACNETNFLEIFVFGNNEQFLILTRFDNLGKGASGAAIQNLNLLCNIDEKIGLEGKI
jgi:N-acetyl-gamma-glutamyl-phosphate reductase